VGEVLDPLGPHALYHNEAPDLHRLESCVTGHVYYNRTPHFWPPRSGTRSDSKTGSVSLPQLPQAGPQLGQSPNHMMMM